MQQADGLGGRALMQQAVRRACTHATSHQWQAFPNKEREGMGFTDGLSDEPSSEAADSAASAACFFRFLGIGGLTTTTAAPASAIIAPPPPPAAGGGGGGGGGGGNGITGFMEK